MLLQHGDGCETRGVDTVPTSDIRNETEVLRNLAVAARRNAEAIRELSRDTSGADLTASLGRTMKSLSAIADEAAAVGASRSSSSLSGRSSSHRSISSSSTSSSSSNQGAGPWLRFALVSIARRDGADYLLRSLYAIFEQMPEEPSHPFRAGTDVVVVNNNEPPEQHRVFYDASTRYAGRARFLTKAAIDPPLECPSRRRSKVKPAVQKQSCDLVSAFGALLGVTPRARHVMLLEDDWLLCPHGLSAALYAVDKAYAYDPRWIALRVSYGFNGVVVKQGDLDSLAHHLATHYSRRPPDHLLFEWFSGERPDTRCAAHGPLRPAMILALAPPASPPPRARPHRRSKDASKSTLMYSEHAALGRPCRKAQCAPTQQMVVSDGARAV